MARSKKLLLIAAILVALAAVTVGVSAAARFYLGGAEQRSATACSGRHGATHTVAISQGQLSHADVSARLCDELVIINKDSTRRRLAFGAHSHHTDYDGADGRLIGQDETLTLVLSKRGEFSFHDHFDDSVHGHFTVE